MQHGLLPPHGIEAGGGLTKMGRANEECPFGQQACVFNATVCLGVGIDAANTSGTLALHSEISTIAAAMSLVFIPGPPICSRLARHEIRPL